EGQRQAGWWRNGFAHDVMVPSWRDQARGNSGSRDDRLTFSCQCHLGEQLPHNSRLDTSKFQRTFDLVLPDWTVGVERMLTEILGK
ncbi:hypothetical protein P0C28_14635, partial [Aeromonas hydrophila]|nr:hypothetical protein [Aeromonas hydrophila]